MCLVNSSFYKPKKGVDIDLLHAFQYEIDDKLFQAKANTLYNKIYENFKIKNISRAGRYGIDQRTINWLCSKNFITDTSIVPYNDYSKSKGLNYTVLILNLILQININGIIQIQISVS